MRHPGPDLKINAGNKQISPLIHKARQIPQAAFSSWGSHMAKKIAGYDDIMTPKIMD